MLGTFNEIARQLRWALAAVVVAGASLLVGSSAAVATTAPPTLAQIEADVAASVKITVAPNPSTTVPPLTSMNSYNASLSPPRVGCWVNSNLYSIPSNANSYCAYGDLLATHTILLTGDSQAGMWLPALDAMGARLHWKIIYFAMRECAPWGNPNPARFVLFKNVTVGDCNSRNAAVAAWARTNRPGAVILSGRGYPKGYTIDIAPNLIALESEMNSAALALNPSGAKLIILGPIPRYDSRTTVYQPADCLDFVTVLATCQQSPSKLIPSVELAAEAYEVAKHHFAVATVSSLMCTSTKCTIFVKDTSGVHLVFYDGAHMNNFFSTWINQGLYTILQPMLPTV